MATMSLHYHENVITSIPPAVSQHFKSWKGGHGWCHDQKLFLIKKQEEATWCSQSAVCITRNELCLFHDSKSVCASALQLVVHVCVL